LLTSADVKPVIVLPLIVKADAEGMIDRVTPVTAARAVAIEANFIIFKLIDVICLLFSCCFTFYAQVRKSPIGKTVFSLCLQKEKVNLK
jgi:hypothetical protein